MSRMVKELRKRKGWTLQQLAEKADLSVSFLSRVESGGRKLSNRSRRQVADALGVCQSDLVDDSPRGPGVKEPATSPPDHQPVEGDSNTGEEKKLAQDKLALITRIAALDNRQVTLVNAFLDALDKETAQQHPQARERAS